MNEPQLITAPTFSPITLADAREACRISSNNEDRELGDWINEAVALLQQETWRQFCTATYSLKFDDFAEEMRLPRPPLASITSIVYYDSAGDQQTLSTDVYEAITDQTPGIVRLKYNQSWPATRGYYDDVTVTYVCGWAADAIPSWLKQSTKYLVAHLYEFRSAQPIPDGIRELLDKAGFAT